MSGRRRPSRACAARAAGSVVSVGLCSSGGQLGHVGADSQISFATGAGDGCVLRMEWLTENRNCGSTDPPAARRPDGRTCVTATMRAIGQPLDNGRGSVHLMVRDEVGLDLAVRLRPDRADFNLDFGVNADDAGAVIEAHVLRQRAEIDNMAATLYLSNTDATYVVHRGRRGRWQHPEVLRR